MLQPNTWAMLCHLCGLLGYFANGVGSIIGPLIVWIIKKDQLAEVDEHGKEAVNFNLSISLYLLFLGAVTFFTLGIAIVITGPLMLAVCVFHVVCTVMAAIKANNHQMYRYPLCIRFIS